MSCANNPVPKMHIGKAIASKWVKNYQAIKQPLLRNTAPLYGDTRALWYNIERWRELVAEAECQGATGIRMYFAAYSESATLPGEGVYIPKEANRMLTAVFVLTKTNAKGIQEDFFIEDQEGYEGRPAHPGVAGEGDFDTGNPCPPGDCSGSLLPLP
jgi:hypothetical protein